MKKFLMMMSLLAAVMAQGVNVPVNPFTYVGRITDAEHVAFDTNVVATIRAFNTNGNLIAQSKTFYKQESKNNYALTIPLAGSALEGYSEVGDLLVIKVEDPSGKIWVGLVNDDFSTVGAPGSVRELNIVLANLSGGYGIDNDLYAQMKALWEDSEYWEYDEEFDINKDYDGDGMSTLIEAQAGTDPYNKDDCFKIVDFAAFTETANTNLHRVVFTTQPGRVYSLETSNDMSDKDSWKTLEFYSNYQEGATPLTVINLSRDANPEGTTTVYLLPTTNSASFFRVKLQ